MNRERQSAVGPQVYLGVDWVFWLLACFCGGCGLGWLGPLSCMVGTPLAVRQFLGLGVWGPILGLCWGCRPVCCLWFPGTPALGCGSSVQLPSPPAGVDAHVSLGCVASGFQCFYGVVDAGVSKRCCYDLESSCLFLLFLSN